MLLGYNACLGWKQLGFNGVKELQLSEKDNENCDALRQYFSESIECNSRHYREVTIAITLVTK